MTLSAPMYTCTDRMGRIILSGMEEVIGCNDILSVFNQASVAELNEPDLTMEQELDLSFETLPQLQTRLEQIYGKSAGRGLAIRSGRACFRHILREFGTEMGLTDLEFRLLSLPTRLKFSIQALAALINRHTAHRAEFEMDDKYLLWTIKPSPLSAEMVNKKSACHLIIGILQETLSWASGGKIYQMEEIHCIEDSDACCQIQIRKNPIN